MKLFEKNKSLLKSLFYNFSNKAILVLSPLIVISLLSRAYEIDEFSSYLLNQGVVIFLTVFVEFGFNISGIRRIANYENKSLEIIQIILCKLFLFLVVSCCCFTYYILKNNIVFSIEVVLFCLLMEVVNPSWYLIGLNKFKLNSSISFLIMILMITMSSLLILMFNQNILLILVVNYALRGTIWLFVLFKEVEFLDKKIKLSFVEPLKDSFAIFLLRVSSSVYTKTPILLLGEFSSASNVVGYTGGERISKGVAGLTSPISNVYFSKLMKKNSIFDEKSLFKQFAVLTFGLAFLLSVAIFFFAKPASMLIYEKHYLLVFPIVQLLSFIPVILAISNIFGNFILIPAGKEKFMNLTVLLSGIVYTLSIMLNIDDITAISLAKIVILTETFNSLMIAFISLRYIKKWN